MWLTIVNHNSSYRFDFERFHFGFCSDQLQKAQQGLDKAGLKMNIRQDNIYFENFGMESNVGRASVLYLFWMSIRQQY